ncbi:ABC transporter permease [Paracoccus pacificus]|uniref:ABC transporter permease n=1 Tax=Paracoccus pacificus TaxID=1463598 RepID=A0ABW4R6R7_9RHOB
MTKAISRARRPGTPPAWLPALASVAAIVLGWAVLAVLVDTPRTLPATWTVARLIWRAAVSGDLWFQTGMTLFRVAASFVLAMGIGAVIGLWLGRSAKADAWLNPALVMTLNIPALVVIVLCYIWIGLNEVAAIIAVAINKIPLVAVIMRDGTRALRPDLDDMARAYHMRPLDRLRHVILPQLAPHFASAARVGIALIWKIVLVVEFLGRSNGVGFKLHMYFQMFDVANVMAWSLSFVIVMLTIDYLILRPWERRANRWRRDED